MRGSGCLVLYGFLVRVLSIAVLVLDGILGNHMCPLNQSSEHRHNPLQFRFTQPLGPLGRSGVANTEKPTRKRRPR
jgi:hypothetical protein